MPDNEENSIIHPVTLSKKMRMDKDEEDMRKNE
jgi:hypothetical protein